MSQTFTCEHCGSTSSQYWKRLSKGNVGALIKLREAIGRLNRNDINIATDIDLTYSERANFSTLRQHGLVAHVRDEGKKIVSGHWLLTTRGAAFLRGELSVPLRVLTMNNRVIDHDTLEVTVDEVVDTRPVFDDRWDYQQTMNRLPVDTQQVGLFDLPEAPAVQKNVTGFFGGAA